MRGMRGFKVAAAMAVAVSAVVCAGVATAADLGAAPYDKTPAYIVPVYNWSGGYIGLNVGYGWGRSADTSGLGAPIVFSDTVTSNMNGVLGGAQIGYNSQIQNWVVGIEADFQGTGQRSTHPLTCPAGVCTGAVLPVTMSQELDFFGTVRARAGFTIVPTVLLYGTAGLAYGQVDGNTNLLGAVRAQNYNPGWTAGGGIEAAMGGGWSARIEYLYLDLARDTQTFNSNVLTVGGGTLAANFNSHVTDNIVRFGLNYKFSGPAISKYE
jgi:outer membrane immunogenic protein